MIYILKGSHHEVVVLLFPQVVVLLFPQCGPCTYVCCFANPSN